MNYRERMREYLKEPDEYSSQYGKWGALNREQRQMITRLLNEMDRADEAIKHQFFEIERLNNIINELNYGIKELDDMFYETFRISQNGYYSISEWELKEFTDKLQELKGSDKE